jgi:hypothetical protein
MKVRAVIMPITTAVGPAELAMWSATRRTPAGSTGPGDYGRISVGEVDGWLDLREAHAMRCPLATHPGTPGRPAAPLLNLRHNISAESGRTHAGLLPGRAPGDDVLAASAPVTST